MRHLCSTVETGETCSVQQDQRIVFAMRIEHHRGKGTVRVSATNHACVACVKSAPCPPTPRHCKATRAPSPEKCWTRGYKNKADDVAEHWWRVGVAGGNGWLRRQATVSYYSQGKDYERERARARSRGTRHPHATTPVHEMCAANKKKRVLFPRAYPHTQRQAQRTSVLAMWASR